MRKARILMSVLGALALAALFLLWLYAGWQEEQAGHVEARSREKAEFALEPEILEYDGEGTLDLMKGVLVLGPEGEDLTDRVQAILTGKGTMTEKEIRYSVFTEEGTETTVTRKLRMVNYTGPRLEVADRIEIDAEDLPDLVKILTEQGDLTADNGFGKDAAYQVSWVRQKQGEGRYTVEFTLKNEYLDEIRKTAQMRVTGDAQDIELTLRESSLQIAAGSEFYPQDWIETARDPVHGDMTGEVQIESRVDGTTPGQYSVIYTLYSYDMTQKAEAVLRVEVV